MSKRITITPAEGTWVVRAGGAVIGESQAALEMQEDGYTPIIYFPRADVAMAFFDRTDLTSTCPFKGVANYYSIVTKSTTFENVVWTYEAPKDDVAAIKDHLAFYTSDNVTVEQV